MTSQTPTNAMVSPVLDLSTMDEDSLVEILFARPGGYEDSVIIRKTALEDIVSQALEQGLVSVPARAGTSAS